MNYVVLNKHLQLIHKIEVGIKKKQKCKWYYNIQTTTKLKYEIRIETKQVILKLQWTLWKYACLVPCFSKCLLS